MLGLFNNDQPTIQIEVRGVSGFGKTLQAIVDSGFNGYLQLPLTEAFPLGLVLAGRQKKKLADGSSASHFICKGTVCVDKKCIVTTIDVVQADIILIGTKLLKELDKTFILDCAAGKVEILDNVSK